MHQNTLTELSIPSKISEMVTNMTAPSLYDTVRAALAFSDSWPFLRRAGSASICTTLIWTLVPEKYPPRYQHTPCQLSLDTFGLPVGLLCFFSTNLRIHSRLSSRSTSASPPSPLHHFGKRPSSWPCPYGNRAFLLKSGYLSLGQRRIRCLGSSRQSSPSNSGRHFYRIRRPDYLWQLLPQRLGH